MLAHATKVSFVEAVYENFKRCAFDAHSSEKYISAFLLFALCCE